MKRNLFFDVGRTLLYPTTGSWFITPNFYNIVGPMDKELLGKSIKRNLHLLDERNILTEDEEYDMFCKFYLKVLEDVKYRDISEKVINSLAYDCVYNDNKLTFYPDVKRELTTLSKKYDLYIISNAWPSTNRILKNYGIFDLFKKIYISSEQGYIKEDKTLFEIALNDVDINDENYFIDDRLELLDISAQYGFIPIIIDRDKDKETNYIEIEKLKDLYKIFKYFED